MNFDDAFNLLTGNPPFPWQRDLYRRLVTGDVPQACDLPTGLGKTSVITVWLVALAHNPRLPRRLVYVVNRRTVVDQSTAEAERLLRQLRTSGGEPIRDALDALAAAPDENPLVISTLRGERADNGAWRRDPSRPAIIVGTVDMVGSRLLFGGYGCGFRSRPLHAGFLGQDALLVHDEAHLEPAFQSLLEAVAREQQRCQEPRPLRVMALSATGRTEADFTLGEADFEHPVVQRRLQARKGLQVHMVPDRKSLPDHVAASAAALTGKVIVFLSSVDDAEKCVQLLGKTHRNAVVALTGTLRGAERDGFVNHPVFARFLPRPDPGVRLQDGTVYLVATSAGEVGIDLSADHLVTDLPPFDALAQRLGRVNRYGEGDAQVHVHCEPLKPPPAAADSQGDASDEDEKPGRRKDEYDFARAHTLELLGHLPRRDDGLHDASPVALRRLPAAARLRAASPLPDIRPVDALLFDRWACTTVTGVLPGRPPVAEWLHGVAEWEPPRTTLAWRREVAWLTPEHLGGDTLDDFLADYPLRSRETLSDTTSRVVKRLQKRAAHDPASMQRAWLLRHDAPARFVLLADLIESYDANRNPSLDDATVVLAPEAGGLSNGLLDGNADFDLALTYDLGPLEGERHVEDMTEEPTAPPGMRLVRAVKRNGDEDGPALWWRLYAAPRFADDEGSRSNRTELLLDVHLRRTEAWAARIASKLALPEHERLALTLAGRVHDLGKQRRVWQRSIRRFAGPPLAKGPMQPAELNHYRHELGSLHDGDFSGLAPEARDLALHAVAAHHGRARPHFPPPECFDPELGDDVAQALAREVPLRFDRLQRRYGRWGLAWLESILRAADVLGSEDDEVAE